MKPVHVAASGDHMPLPTLALSAADVVSVPRALSVTGRAAVALHRFFDRLKARAECRHLERTIENGEGHLVVLKASVAKTELELADLRVQLILAEKRRDA